MKQFILTFIVLLFISCEGDTVETTLKLIKADNLFKKEHYKEAIRLYDDVISIIDPHSSTKNFALYNKAHAFYCLGEYEKSISSLDLAMTINKNDVMHSDIHFKSLKLKGRISSKLNKKRDALNFYLLASTFKQDSGLYSNIGLMQVQLGEYKNAVNNLNTAIDLDTKNAYAYSNRGLAYLKLNQNAEALNDFKKSEELDASNPYLYKNKALFSIENKEINLACQELKKAKELGFYDFGNENNIKCESIVKI